ncbi:phosphonate ABC transporter, permease protein PhnE [Actinomadura sp. KC216]|uniref:phosphonate ABC transporter, permease protein PhnE n=1 Tax=Actinomadura sp. KC216 TaxID=2530370 RepID=UPI002442242A|nr:phosphonate ABC transporter, permease protein PhnE [Actinomadura sp. KC216]
MPKRQDTEASRVRRIPAAEPLAPSPPPPRTRHRRFRWWAGLLTVVAVVWSLRGTDVGLGSLVQGREGAARLLTGLVPPDLSEPMLRMVAQAAFETLQISIAALFLGALMGLPLAVLIAGNVRGPRWLSSSARVTAAFLRGVPELLWALLFVATVGLGPAAGVYAVSLHAAGLLAKLCSEQLEAVDPAPVEAMRLTGASRHATMLLAILPQARNGIVSILLYQWECNIRSSAIIGFVGAGGIGQALGISLRLFRYEELATLLVAVLILILGVDRISRGLRSRMGAATR